MNYFEASIAVKLKAEDADAALALAEKIATAMSNKVGPCRVDTIWSIRPEEYKK